MKVCVTPTDLCEHYQHEHTGTEGRQELRDLPAVTVGLVYFVSIALVMGCFKWTYIFSHGLSVNLLNCFFWFLDETWFDLLCVIPKYTFGRRITLCLTFCFAVVSHIELLWYCETRGHGYIIFEQLFLDFLVNRTITLFDLLQTQCSDIYSIASCICFVKCIALSLANCV